MSSWSFKNIFKPKDEKPPIKAGINISVEDINKFLEDNKEKFHGEQISSIRKFDLNIEEILENWETYHAIREIIANAIDETFLSKADKDVLIFKNGNGSWHIRDFGRGLKYEHFTQNENEEKLSSKDTIGKFGIGLKDALATFDRKNIKVLIKSKFNNIELGKSQKNEFDDLITLHAFISPASDDNFIGTEFILSNITDEDISNAKNLFLKFCNPNVLEKTRFGDVIFKNSTSGSIYINGVKVAEEDNFLFDYNITNISAQIKKALNRERTNIGRTAYAPSIKSILLNCQTKEIASRLVNDLKEFTTGNTHDELKWIDVQEHAVKLLNQLEKVVFVTSDQRERATDLIEEAREGGFEVVTIPTNLQIKIEGQTDLTGTTIRDFSTFRQERDQNFEFKFISIDQLSDSEKSVFSSTNKIFKILGRPSNLSEIKISETMQKDDYTFRASDGLWDGQNIIIKRTVLEHKERFIAVFLHELAHCISGASDATRSFEAELTRLLGIFGQRAIV